MPKRADAIAQRLVLIACPGRIAIRLDQLQDIDAYRPFGGRPLHGSIIGIVPRRSRADNVLLERSDERSGGKEWVRPGVTRCSPDHLPKKHYINPQPPTAPK